MSNKRSVKIIDLTRIFFINFFYIECLLHFFVIFVIFDLKRKISVSFFFFVVVRMKFKLYLYSNKNNNNNE